MEDLSRSTFIFDLIGDYQIFSKSGVTNELADEAYYSFCKKYISFSKQRDCSLIRYLNATPNLFRVYLPYSKWAMSVASSVVWYYDEVVISDPILQLINSNWPEQNIEEQKDNLQHLLAFMADFKESIGGGYLLFFGHESMPPTAGQIDSIVESLIEFPRVTDAFEKASLIIKKPSPINNNPNDNLTQLEVHYEGLWGNARTMGMYIPEHVFNAEKLSNGISYDFIAPYQRIEKDELAAYNKLDMLAGLKQEYRKDISIIVESVGNSQRLNSALLFYRDVDCAVADSYMDMQGNRDQLVDKCVYNCLLPYVKGIPSERLFDIRSEIPEAFKDFRAFLFDLVAKTMSSTNDPTEIRFKIENEIRVLMRKLNVEMSNAKSKWSFQGIAAPLIMLTGSLTLFSSGIDYSALVSTLLGSGGIVQSLKTFNDVTEARSKASLNPAYFLWRAQQS